jgi:translin
LNLKEIESKVGERLKEKDLAREEAIKLCREVIRLSQRSIRCTHREEFPEGRSLLVSARATLDKAYELLLPHPELRFSGFVHDAQKEYVEGEVTLRLILSEELPPLEELKVEPPAYLNGLGEAVGELRRYILDAMRKGDLSRGEDILTIMDDIYGMLTNMDFPDGITGGLRRTTDIVRGILEKTRGDLTLAMRQKEFTDRL